MEFIVKDYSLRFNCERSPKTVQTKSKESLKTGFTIFVSFLIILINFEEPHYFLRKITNFITKGR